MTFRRSTFGEIHVEAYEELTAEQRQAIVDKIMARSVPVANGCREWTRAIVSARKCDGKGYGTMSVPGLKRKVPPGAKPSKPYLQLSAHRVLWIVTHGFPGFDPESGLPMEVAHRCDNPQCVNIDHLEVLSPRENRKNQRARRTHCHRGHVLDRMNVYISRDRDGYEHRRCKTCQRAASERYFIRRRLRRSGIVEAA